MYTADELEIRRALAGSQRSEQLIAYLEGEIAKRDEELAACRVAVKNCELFWARIVELEADRESWADRWIKSVNCGARLEEELDAIKAQDTVGEVVGWYRLDRPYEMTSYPSVCATWHRLGAPVAPLYAAPVSEAKAQGVVMPEPDIKTGHGYPAYSVAAVTELFARLKAAPVQQVSVADGSTKMQWPEIVALVNEVLGCEAHKYPCERGSIGHEMTGINFNSLARIIDRVRYAAAPAAPAADAGLVEALDYQALFDAIAAATSVYANGAINISVQAFRESLAAHSAKGVV